MVYVNFAFFMLFIGIGIEPALYNDIGVIVTKPIFSNIIERKYHVL